MALQQIITDALVNVGVKDLNDSKRFCAILKDSAGIQCENEIKLLQVFLDNSHFVNVIQSGKKSEQELTYAGNRLCVNFMDKGMDGQVAYSLANEVINGLARYFGYGQITLSKAQAQTVSSTKTGASVVLEEDEIETMITDSTIRKSIRTKIASTANTEARKIESEGFQSIQTIESQFKAEEKARREKFDAFQKGEKEDFGKKNESIFIVAGAIGAVIGFLMDGVLGAIVLGGIGFFLGMVIYNKLIDNYNTLHPHETWDYGAERNRLANKNQKIELMEQHIKEDTAKVLSNAEREKKEQIKAYDAQVKSFMEKLSANPKPLMPLLRYSYDRFEEAKAECEKKAGTFEQFIRFDFTVNVNTDAINYRYYQNAINVKTETKAQASFEFLTYHIHKLQTSQEREAVASMLCYVLRNRMETDYGKHNPSIKMKHDDAIFTIRFEMINPQFIPNTSLF